MMLPPPTTHIHILKEALQQQLSKMALSENYNGSSTV